PRLGEFSGDAPGDRMIVGNAHDERALAGEKTCNTHHASSRLKTSEALVPPKPNELDRTAPISALSLRSRSMGISAKAGSSSSICALSTRKPLFIIRSE